MQYRIWCSFEASIVALRKLPVLAVGHQPSPLQRKLVSCGPLLTVDPWSSDDGSGVGVLGKVNFFYACSTVLFAWSSFGLLVGRFDDQSFGTLIVVNWLIFQFILTVFYLYSRTWLQHEVMLARNAQRVLKLLMGAKPERRQRERWIGELTGTLPWLPAYDRRDVVTVRMVLDKLMSTIEHTLERRSIAGAGRPGTYPYHPSTYRGSIVAYLDDVGEEPIRRCARALGSVNAVAVSAYFHAIAVPSNSDAPRGRSLNTWLSEIGIDLRAYHASKEGPFEMTRVGTATGRGSSRRGDEWSCDLGAKSGAKFGGNSRLNAAFPDQTESASAKAEGETADAGVATFAASSALSSSSWSRAAWMHEYPILRAQHTTAEVASSELHIEAESCDYSMSAEEGWTAVPQLLSSELMGCGWEFVRLGFGFSCVVTNPTGSWALAPPIKDGGDESTGDGRGGRGGRSGRGGRGGHGGRGGRGGGKRSVASLPHAEASQAEWRLTNMLPLQPFQRPLRLFTFLNSVLIPVGFLLLSASVVVSSVSSSNRHNITTLAFTSNFVTGLNFIALAFQRIASDCMEIRRCRRLHIALFPLPLRKAFKIELVVLTLAFAAFVAVSYGSDWVAIESVNGLGGWVPISAELWFAFLLMVMFTFGREALVAFISAVSGVKAYGSVLALSEFGARKLERDARNIIG